MGPSSMHDQRRWVCEIGGEEEEGAPGPLLRLLRVPPRLACLLNTICPSRLPGVNLQALRTGKCMMQEVARGFPSPLA